MAQNRQTSHSSTRSRQDFFFISFFNSPPQEGSTSSKSDKDRAEPCREDLNTLAGITTVFSVPLTVISDCTWGEINVIVWSIALVCSVLCEVPEKLLLQKHHDKIKCGSLLTLQQQPSSKQMHQGGVRHPPRVGPVKTSERTVWCFQCLRASFFYSIVLQWDFLNWRYFKDKSVPAAEPPLQERCFSWLKFKEELRRRSLSVIGPSVQGLAFIMGIIYKYPYI